MPNVDQLFEVFRQPGMPGASVGAIRRGQVVLRQAWGLADVEAVQAATPATNYRLASVTKQLTAMAVMLLAHDRALAYDDPARRWLPHLPGYAQGVTLRQLLTHTSGLADYEDHIPAGQTEQVHDDDIPALLPCEGGAYFSPGAAYRYSNTGYVLLALIAEQASGRPFGDLLRERIFTPLGMAGTLAHEHGRTVVTQRAFGYSLDDGRVERTDQSVTSATLGDGGVYSTVDDQARWAAALEGEALLPRAAQRAAFQPHVSAGDGAAYGYGWFVGARRGQPIVYHDGTTTGFRTAIVRYPERQLALIVLTNRSAAEPLELAHAVADEC
jgi:CubicO group peptidase (beta-lactamase class C family)